MHSEQLLQMLGALGSLEFKISTSYITDIEIPRCNFALLQPTHFFYLRWTQKIANAEVRTVALPFRIFFLFLILSNSVLDICAATEQSGFNQPASLERVEQNHEEPTLHASHPHRHCGDSDSGDCGDICSNCHRGHSCALQPRAADGFTTVDISYVGSFFHPMPSPTLEGFRRPPKV